MPPSPRASVLDLIKEVGPPGHSVTTFEVPYYKGSPKMVMPAPARGTGYPRHVDYAGERSVKRSFREKVVRWLKYGPVD